jgi:hypothetical protein
MARVDRTIQVLLPLGTFTTLTLTSLKMPQFAILVTLCVQPIWYRSSWLACRRGGQWGMFATTVIASVIAAAGTINYWLLK